MSALTTGLSALQVSQRLLDLTGQNVANASTPGYHRQVADLAALNYGQPIGSGVQIQQINRPINGYLEEALLQNSSEGGNVSAQLTTLQQVQGLLAPGQGSLASLVGQFFNALTQLAASPSDPTLQGSVVSAATNLTRSIQALSGGLQQMQMGLDAQSTQQLQQVNQLTAQIARLNGAIRSAESQGAAPNDLLDQRDQAVSQLSALVDVRTIDQGQGTVNILVGGAAVVEGTQSTTLQYKVGAGGRAAVVAADDPGTALRITGGSIGGNLAARNQSLPALRQQLDALAHALIRNVDEVHATGLSASGPSATITSTRAVSDTSVPIDQAGLTFPPQAGSLTVTVSDLAGGTRTNATIAIDPATQSLQDVASALSSIAHVHATANAQTGTLQIDADPGYGIDFAGRLPSGSGQIANPDTAGILTALGLNSFFQGSSAVDIDVSSDLANNPGALNTSLTGLPGDGSTVLKLAALQDAPLLPGDQTFQGFADAAVAGVGSQVQDLTQQQAAQQAIGKNLEAQQQSVSGVDTNEELVKLLQYQQAFQMSAKYLSTVSATLSDLMSIIS